MSTTVFAALDEAAHGGWPKVLLAVVSLSATGFAAAVTFLKYQEEAESHRIGAAEYTAIGRALDNVLASVELGKDAAQIVRALDGITQRLDAIGERVLPVSMPGEPPKGGREVHDTPGQLGVGPVGPGRDEAHGSARKLERVLEDIGTVFIIEYGPPARDTEALATLPPNVSPDDAGDGGTSVSESDS